MKKLSGIGEMTPELFIELCNTFKRYGKKVTSCDMSNKEIWELTRATFKSDFDAWIKSTPQTIEFNGVEIRNSTGTDIGFNYIEPEPKPKYIGKMCE